MPTIAQRTVRFHFSVAALAVATGLSALFALPAQASIVIAGHVFEDLDRDGTRDVGEGGLTDVVLYLYDLDRATYLGNAVTDASGRYSIGVPRGGEYLLEIASVSWRDLRDDWTPTNAQGLRPAWHVSTEAGEDLGLRRIVRTELPTSTLVGPSGVTIESYNDVVTADDVHAELLRGTLLGDEAPHVTIRLDAGSTTACSAGAVRQGGEYVSFAATCDLAWQSWVVGGPRALFHEYGHAWSYYHAYLTQQDPQFTDYLEARGIVGDERLGSSHAWNRAELIAEDFRQLFGSPDGRRAVQENQDLPPAAEVEGLEEYLRNEFTQTPRAGSAPEPSPDPEPEPSPDHDAAVDPDPEPGAEQGEEKCHPRRGCGGDSSDAEPVRCHPKRGC